MQTADPAPEHFVLARCSNRLEVMLSVKKSFELLRALSEGSGSDNGVTKNAAGARAAAGAKGAAPASDAASERIAASDPEITVIRKYGNRRLYDTKRSRYVTLEELAEQIRSGTRCEVRDAVTGEDLTRTVLTQIILGEGGRGTSMLPEGFLHNVIAMCGGEHNKTLFPAYLDMTMESFLQQRERWSNMLAGSFDDGASDKKGGADSLASPAAAWSYASPYSMMQKQAESNMAMFHQFLGAFSPPGMGGEAPRNW